MEKITAVWKFAFRVGLRLNSPATNPQGYVTCEWTGRIVSRGFLKTRRTGRFEQRIGRLAKYAGEWTAMPTKLHLEVSLKGPAEFGWMIFYCRSRIAMAIGNRSTSSIPASNRLAKKILWWKAGARPGQVITMRSQ